MRSSRRVACAGVVALAGLLTVAGCSGGTYLVVTVAPGPGRPASVAKIDLALTLGGRTARRTVAEAAGATALPVDVGFEVTSGAGAIGVDATAYDATGLPVGSGHVDGAITRGQTTRLTVTLGGDTLDAGAPADLTGDDALVGSDDLLAADGALLDDASGDAGLVGDAAVDGDRSDGALGDASADGAPGDGASDLRLDAASGGDATLADLALADLTNVTPPDLAATDAAAATDLATVDLATVDLAPAACTPAASISFAPQANAVPVGSNPTWLATGDFNGDGLVDVVAANHGSASLTIALNDGLGSLKPGPTILTGMSPNAVAVADWNGDGLPDLGVATASGVQVFLGNGKLGFSLAATLSLYANADSLAGADFDGDGHLDFAIRYGGGVTFVHGNGFGGGGVARAFNVGSTPTHLGVADLDNDGKPDVYVADASGTFGTSGVGIISLLNRSTPLAGFSFSSSVTSGPSTATGGYAATAVDLNGDGALDGVVTANGSSQVLLFPNDGLGRFKPPTVRGVGSQPRLMAEADVDCDGRRDVAIATYGAPSLTILRNTGSILAPSTQMVLAPTGVNAVAFVDLNRDGRPDLVVAGSTANALYCGLNTSK